MDALGQLHLLRPWWLLALLPALLLTVLLWRRKNSVASWRRAIAPALLEHLLEQHGGRGQRAPWLLLATAWVLATLALAGPTWEKLPQPVLQQRDALVLVLDLSLSMYAEDIKPSRLLRARYKVLDILERRSEGLTGLVAYSGDAHVVAPLTDDTATIANLMPALAPAMMPVYGSDPVAGVEQALELLHNAGFRRGRILLISDEITEDNIDAIAARLGDGNWQLSVLGIGTEQGGPIVLPGQPDQGGGFLKQPDGSIAVARLHRERFERLTQRVGGRYSDVRLDDADLDALLPHEVGEADEMRSVDREFDQWRERGPWLAMLLLPLAALAFRRGWLLVFLLLPLSPPSQALEWRDLWQRPDQQGSAALQAGDAAAAAEEFRDPDWRGSARYRAGDYPGAAQDFQHTDSAEAAYNRGNALARAGQLQEAIAAYDAALAKNPQLDDAKSNRELVQKLLQQQQQQQNSQNQNQDQNQQGENQQQDSAQQGQQQPQQGQGQDSQDPSQQPQAGADQNNDAGQNAQQQPAPTPEQKQQQDAAGNNGATPPPAQPDTEPGKEQPEAGAAADAKDKQDGEPQNPANAAAGDADNSEQQREQRATEQWLRQIPDDPSGLLRRKFNYEHRQRNREGAPRDSQQPLW